MLASAPSAGCEGPVREDPKQRTGMAPLYKVAWRKPPPRSSRAASDGGSSDNGSVADKAAPSKEGAVGNARACRLRSGLLAAPAAELPHSASQAPDRQVRTRWIHRRRDPGADALLEKLRGASAHTRHAVGAKRLTEKAASELDQIGRRIGPIRDRMEHRVSRAGLCATRAASLTDIRASRCASCA